MNRKKERKGVCRMKKSKFIFFSFNMIPGGGAK